jgi:hypothetical protein
MNDKLKRLEDIKIENIVWIIYIGIIILSWYANSKEKKYLLYNDLLSKKEYQNLLILIFTILVIIYFYFAKSGYEDILNLTSYDSPKKQMLTKFAFIGSFLILVSGIIYLVLAILDDEIEIELAFN